jgi:hypothetical protein
MNKERERDINKREQSERTRKALNGGEKGKRR